MGTEISAITKTQGVERRSLGSVRGTRSSPKTCKDSPDAVLHKTAEGERCKSLTRDGGRRENELPVSAKMSKEVSWMRARKRKGEEETTAFMQSF